MVDESALMIYPKNACIYYLHEPNKKFSTLMVRLKKSNEETPEIIAEQRLQASTARLRQLERDQAAKSIDTIGIDSDLLQESEESDEEGRVLTKRKFVSNPIKKSKGLSVIATASRGTKRSAKTVDMILMSDVPTSSNTDTFTSIEAPPATKIPGSRLGWKLCSVCSMLGKYRCVKCGSRFCSLQCQSTHRDTRCVLV